MTLSDTQILVLSRANQHEARLAAAPPGLPAAARDAVFRSMVKNGLLAECAAPRDYAGLAWRRDPDGAGVALRITDAGQRAIGGDQHEGADAAPEDVPPAEAARDAATVPGEAAHADSPALLGRAEAAPAPRDTLRGAAQAVLDTWDEADRGALAGPMERLRAALAKPARAAQEPGAPHRPREGTKRAAVLALRRCGGCSGGPTCIPRGWTSRWTLKGSPPAGRRPPRHRIPKATPARPRPSGSPSRHACAARARRSRW